MWHAGNSLRCRWLFGWACPTLTEASRLCLEINGHQLRISWQSLLSLDNLRGDLQWWHNNSCVSCLIVWYRSLAHLELQVPGASGEDAQTWPTTKTKLNMSFTGSFLFWDSLVILPFVLQSYRFSRRAAMQTGAEKIESLALPQWKLCPLPVWETPKRGPAQSMVTKNVMGLAELALMKRMGGFSGKVTQLKSF